MPLHNLTNLKNCLIWSLKTPDSAYDSVVYDQVKTGSSESQAEAEEINQSPKRENVHCDWLILLLLLPTPSIWFSLDDKRRSSKRSRNKMETF